MSNTERMLKRSPKLQKTCLTQFAKHFEIFTTETSASTQRKSKLRKKTLACLSTTTVPVTQDNPQTSLSLEQVAVKIRKTSSLHCCALSKIILHMQYIDEYIWDPYVTYTFSSLAASTYPAFSSIPFDLWAHVIVDHWHSHSVECLIILCICTGKDTQNSKYFMLNKSFCCDNGSIGKWVDVWVKEGSTFGFPPSIHGAVGAFGDVTLFYWKMNSGGALRHRGRTRTNTKIVLNYSYSKNIGYCTHTNKSNIKSMW